MNDKLLTAVTFDSLHLPPTLKQGVDEAEFTFCTPIQAKALPLALAGQDVEGQAQTGTGKTAAFLLAIMNHLLRCSPPAKHKEGDPRAIVLAPTRELAIQIHKDAELLGKHTDLRICVVYGGAAYESQRETLRAGIDVLIGTPGRTIDYLKQRIFSLKSIQAVVLDEADRMFDLGFIKDIRYLLRRMPPPEKRLNLLFSATLSHRVSELAYEHMNAPTVVNASPEQVTVGKVDQVLYHVSREEKIPLLLGLLKHIEVTRTIIFVNTKRTAERVAAYLTAHDFHAGILSGDVPQHKRLRLLERFRHGQLPILVATDVAARGLHIPDVSHIFNFDLPQDAEDYVHRIGRTARAGAGGDALSFACEEYVYSLPEIEAFIGTKIPTEPVVDGLLVRPMSLRKRPRRVSQAGQSASVNGEQQTPSTTPARKRRGASTSGARSTPSAKRRRVTETQGKRSQGQKRVRNADTSATTYSGEDR
ncbi:MAG: DEAD/DEAH box helicase [Gammaproteobacteria bacterium]|jgi:ATP-dependent RNA helicase RhlB